MRRKCACETTAWRTRFVIELRQVKRRPATKLRRTPSAKSPFDGARQEGAATGRTDRRLRIHAPHRPREWVNSSIFWLRMIRRALSRPLHTPRPVCKYHAIRMDNM